MFNGNIGHVVGVSVLAACDMQGCYQILVMPDVSKSASLITVCAVGSPVVFIELLEWS